MALSHLFDPKLKSGYRMFMKPRLELLALNTGLNQTMPWAGLARSHLAPSTRRYYDGDVGFEKGDDSPTMESLETVPGFVLFVSCPHRFLPTCDEHLAYLPDQYPHSAAPEGISQDQSRRPSGGMATHDARKLSGSHQSRLTLQQSYGGHCS